MKKVKISLLVLCGCFMAGCAKKEVAETSVGVTTAAVVEETVAKQYWRVGQNLSLKVMRRPPRFRMLVQ